MNEAQPPGKNRGRWTPAWFFVALLFGATTAGADARAPVVRLKDESVPRAELVRAIVRCQRDAQDLPLAACIEKFQAPVWRLERQALATFSLDAPLRMEAEQRALADTLLDVLRREANADQEAIARFLAEHEAEWTTPERLRLFRILVPTRQQADQLITDLQRATVADFRTAARAHSIDHSSHERGGDLGFVAADGSTDVPHVRADPALFQAARAVEDGAFVTQPVPEGEHFAVVWRRGRLPARTMPQAEAEAWAARRLRDLGVRRELDRLIEAQQPEKHADLLARLRRDECRLFRR